MENGFIEDGRPLRIAAVGCGYWGRNIVRSFHELGTLHAVCDADPDLAQQFADKYNVPALPLAAILEGDFDGIAFATPAALHADHVCTALEAGKHVFVEKPLALAVESGRVVSRLAAKCCKIVMVGHLLRHHPLVIEMISLVHAGRVGRLQHVVSNRLNLGKLRTEEDVIWSFAPHDLSVTLALYGGSPAWVSVEASAILNPEIPDIATIHMGFGEAATACVTASWLHPFKEQKLSIIGSTGCMVFDDTLDWDRKLAIYDHKVEIRNGRPEAVKAEPSYVVVPRLEPLKEECAHFLACIRTGATPRTDPVEALAVLTVLDAATKARKTGSRVVLAPDAARRPG